METVELLAKELENQPEALVGEVLDFARFLKAKNGLESRDLLLWSESALSKDWLRPEEDEAWKDL